ncbi:thioesterase domain-containing protein [Lachnospiraceae bacterium KK002]
MNKKIQLFLLPFAGGDAYSFKNLTDELDSRIDAITVEYAGHGTRRKEKFIVDYQEFLEDVLSNINEQRVAGAGYAVLGYSMGSAITFDLLTKKLLDGNPLHAFLCARGCPKYKSPTQSYYALSEDEFISKVMQLGGMEERLLTDKRFSNIYLRPLRADYNVWSQYKYDESDENLSCNLSVFYSSKDETCINPFGWAELTSGNVDFYEMGENHFFILQHYKEMAEIISKVLIEDEV